MPDSDRILKHLSLTMLASADPATRAKMLPRLRQGVQKDINEQYGDLLSVAPSVHFLPLQPKKDKQRDVAGVVKEALAWLGKQPGMMGAYLYELAQPEPGSGPSGGTTPPRFLLILHCAQKDVMVRLRKHPDGARLQAKLNELCEGVSATEEGEFGVNTLLVGLA